MSEKIATREAYGKALVELGHSNPDVVVLDADLSCSTKTGYFAKAFPERFFNMGVSEQDMMGTAAGLALCGKITYASSFAMFATGRAFEIVRNSIAYPHLPVKICATHSGLTVGEDGASHQSLVDICIMRALPNMTVIVPADATETQQVIHQIANLDGPVYVRLSRAGAPVLFDETYQFQVGKAKVLQEGEDLVIVSCGNMVAPSLEAAKNLAEKNIHCTVLNLATIKPLDIDTIKKYTLKSSKVLTVEEHSILGGMGSAIAELLCEEAKIAVYRMGVKDEFGQSGSAQALLKHYHLTADDIFETALKFVKK